MALSCSDRHRPHGFTKSATDERREPHRVCNRSKNVRLLNTHPVNRESTPHPAQTFNNLFNNKYAQS